MKESLDVVFSSRGRGRGHAVRDLAILKELRVLSPDINAAFISYDTGAQALRESGELTFDLGLPEKNPFTETVIRTAQLLEKLRPSIVVAQEEAAALIAARIFNIPSLFSTHWFPLEPHPSTQHLSYADKVLFMEQKGLFIEPKEVAGRVIYTGRIVRRLTPTLGGAENIRRSFGLTANDLMILVLPGSPPEDREPIAQFVLDAFNHLPIQKKTLVWVSPRDLDVVRTTAVGVSNVHVMSEVNNFDDMILASNVVITKGTYNLTNEIQMLGRHSISLTHRYNPIDDYFVLHCPGSTSIDVKTVSPDTLTRMLSGRPAQNWAYGMPFATADYANGPNRAAVQVHLFLNQFRAKVC